MALRRVILVTLTCFFLLMYLYPRSSKVDHSGPNKLEWVTRCIEDRLFLFQHQLEEGNLNIHRNDGEPDSFLPFVGNGFLGVSFGEESNVFIRKGRTLALPLNWSPIISVVDLNSVVKESLMTDFYSGTVRRYQCFSSGLRSSYVYYAHRNKPNLFMQEILIDNPTSIELRVIMTNTPKLDWATSSARMVRINEGKTERGQYQLYSGVLKDEDKVPETDTVVIILTRSSQSVFQIQPHRSVSFRIPSIVCVETIAKGKYYDRKNMLENRCLQTLKSHINVSISQLKYKEEHVTAWHRLWGTGMSISRSKAAGALNGDRINATIYYVLSHILPYGRDNNENASYKIDRGNYASLVEGCYGGYHHTLQARNLWKSLSTIRDVGDIVSLWLLTLEKQGCNKSIATGAFGVMQAMVLSFGGFRFSSQHLEFKIDPKYLHRDYVFRRIRYDKTYFNVTVTLQDDNKAVLGVSLDRNEKTYYACDGGCIEEPVILKSSISYFPVKMTDPITSILYITPDKDHMELIKDTLHVHKIVEAPAHDHHVIALHKHGHHLGGLPVLFWASICFLIIIFHLFLFKLIFNEYCDKPDKYRVRRGKM